MLRAKRSFELTSLEQSLSMVAAGSPPDGRGVGGPVSVGVGAGLGIVGGASVVGGGNGIPDIFGPTKRFAAGSSSTPFLLNKENEAASTCKKMAASPFGAHSSASSAAAALAAARGIQPVFPPMDLSFGNEFLIVKSCSNFFLFYFPLSVIFSPPLESLFLT